MNIESIEQLVHLLKENDLKSIKYKNNGLELEIQDKVAADIVEGIRVTPSIQVSETSLPAQEEAETGASNLYDIKSQQIGTFYTQASEDSPETFVKVGDRVDTNTQIGLIEAMKIFTEVVSPVEGVIEEILVSNGQQVDFGQLLMRVKVSEA